MIIVPEDMRQRALAASILLGKGEQPNLVLPQWGAENGWSWPWHNNPGNISDRHLAQDRFTHSWLISASAVQDNGALVYPTPEAGICAYVMLMMSLYGEVWAQGTPQALFAALGRSGWAESRYMGTTGEAGGELMEIYRELKEG